MSKGYSSGLISRFVYQLILQFSFFSNFLLNEQNNLCLMLRISLMSYYKRDRLIVVCFFSIALIYVCYLFAFSAGQKSTHHLYVGRKSQWNIKRAAYKSRYIYIYIYIFVIERWFIIWYVSFVLSFLSLINYW